MRTLKFMFFSIMLFALQVSNAQIAVTIGSSSGTSSLIPVNHNTAYSYTQQIIYQSEIGVAGSITKIRFNMTGVSISNSNTWVIYMGHTSKTSFGSGTDWVDVAGLTQVYSGIVTSSPAAGWMEIVLPTPFEYNNTDNIVIAVDENKSGSNSGAAFNVWTPSTTNRALRAFNSSANINPVTPGTGMQVSSVNYLQFEMIPTSNVQNPLTFTANAISTEQIDLNWTKNTNNNDVVIAMNTSNTFVTLTNGHVYTVNETIAGGGTIIYNGNLNSFNHSSLNSNTPYFYRAWSVDGNVDYSTGISARDTTFAKYYHVYPSVVNGNGNIYAYVNGTEIFSGDTVREDKIVAFVAEPNPVHRVKEWKLNGNIINGNTSNFDTLYTLQSDANVSVEFEAITTYPVSFAVVNGNGTIGAQVDGYWINSGDTVQEFKDVVFTATPAFGFGVKEWKLDGVIVSGNTSNTYTLQNLQDTASVTVEYKVVQMYNVTFSVVNGNGTIAANVDGNPISNNAQVAEGKDVYFIATPNNGYQVKEWKYNGNIMTGNTTNSFIRYNLSGNANVTVEFEQIPNTNYTLTLEINPVNAGTVFGSGTIAQGASVNVSTNPSSSNFVFVNWTKGVDVVSTNMSFSYTMPAENVTLVANYTDVTSIIESTSSTIKVLPNPSNGQFTIIVDQEYKMQIMDEIGRVIVSQNIQTGENKLNLENFKSGIYFIQLNSIGNSKMMKIIKY